MAFARANVEWLAGKTGDARNLYRAAVGRLNQAGTDIAAYDRLRLGRAYARLGDEKTAMQELAAATADKRMSQGVLGELYIDRKSVEEGKRVSERVDLGGRGIIKKKNTKINHH